MSISDLQNPVSHAPDTEQRHDVMPTLFGDGYGLYEVRKGSFVVSFILNTAILALLIWIGSWTATHVPEIKQVTGIALDISPYVMSPSNKRRVAEAVVVRMTCSRPPKAHYPSCPRRR